MAESAVADKNIFKKINSFFNQFKVLKFKPGQIITTPNNPLTEVYFIKTGRMRIYAISEDGEDVTLHIAKPGSYFPMMLILGRAKTNYYSEALTKVELRQAPYEEVLRFIKNDPEVMFDLTTRFAAGLCGMMVRIEKLASGPSSKKLELLISYFAKNYGKQENGETVLDIHLTHSMLGSWLGLNRETVTRQIKALQERGLIGYKDGLLVVKM